MKIKPSTLLTLVAAFVLSLPSAAQLSAPPNTADALRDTSMLKPPLGAKVAIYEFEDLVRHDWPLPMHVWSFDAAVIARYIQDKIAPQAAEEYRRAVFANQTSIASKDDLQAFTQKYFQAHGRAMPFVIDPSGLFTQEVKADATLAERIGLRSTPTIFVVTNKGWTQVTNVNYLYAAIDAALAATETGEGATRAKR
jgi:protein-disulfide isomerase